MTSLIGKTTLVTRGANITYLQQNLLRKMDSSDATRVVQKAEDLVSQLPAPDKENGSRQALLLGLIQSGKTVALTTSIALAADNGYSCFIVLTSDNIWLYNQTIERIKEDLPRLQIEEKEDWNRQEMLMPIGLMSADGKGLVLVATKNATVLDNLSLMLDRLRINSGGRLPPALVFDDEADQASLDTQKNRRAKNPTVDSGRINTLIRSIRGKFPFHTLVQVTATPQALFLQEEEDPFRPEFVITLEPGKGYIGGTTFFSLIEDQSQKLLRRIEQTELDIIINPRTNFELVESVPASLGSSICVFFVGATIKYLQKRAADGNNTSYSYLCHISEKMKDHDRAEAAISIYYSFLLNSLSSSATASLRLAVEQALRDAYNEVMKTFSDKDNPAFTFDIVFNEIKDFIAGTDIQTINSGADQARPRYSSRYNILIGGTKLARGVTIDGLIVTYYGRQAKRPNIDTMLQHARMYGYRQDDLDVTRLYVTSDVESRFRLINESEQALREVIQKYPNRVYRGIKIGKSLNPTRKNVTNPNNIGAYAAGKSYFPTKPKSNREDIGRRTEQIDKVLDNLYPGNTGPGVPISITQMIALIKLTVSDPTGPGLWEDRRMIAALETLKSVSSTGDRALLIVRRNRGLNPNESGIIRSYFGGAARGERGDVSLADPEIPTLFMFRLRGDAPSASDKPGWYGVPFWIPNVRFPDGEYALMFNFE